MKTQIDIQQDRECISALMDGCLSGTDLNDAMRALETAEARERWTLYHVVGDVLRSSELAAFGRDAQFMDRLRAEMADTTVDRPAALPNAATAVVAVAHAARPAANDSVFRWKMVAGLASFAAVAAVGWGLWGSIDPQAYGGGQLAQANAPAGGRTQVVALVPQAPTATAPAAADEDSDPPTMLRDARLDELLAAHRRAAGASALGDASGFLRNATFEGHGR